MRDIIESFEIKHGLDIYKVNIAYDDILDSPRDWDNITNMFTFHKRYNLGDEHNYNYDDFDGWEGFEEQLKLDYDIKEILPIYMYEHSGITINTMGFSCGWDSGKIGYIFITNDTIKKEFIDYGYNKTDKEIRDVLISDVSVYDQYIRGDVYYYSIENKEGDIIDSLGGLYGLECAINEAKQAVNYFIKDELKNNIKHFI